MNKVDFDTIEETIKTSGVAKLIADQKMDCYPLVVSGVPDLWQADFCSHGFAIYAQYHDYWIDNLAPSASEYGEFDFLNEDECGIASEISIACRGQSRGFEGEPPEWFGEWLKDENLHNAAVLVNRANNRIVGISCTATYAHDSEKGAVAWVRMLAVHPDFQRRGIGKKLLIQTLKYGANHGAKRAFLHADAENFAAIRIYSNAGFVSCGGIGQIDMILKQ